MKVGERYLSKRDGSTAVKVLEEDSVRMTAIVEYENGKNAGKNTCLTTATLKRWYSLIEEGNASEDTESTEHTSEISKPDKPKKKRSKKVDRTSEYAIIVEGLNLKFDVKEYTSSPGCMGIRNKDSETNRNIAYVEVRNNYVKVYSKGIGHQIEYGEDMLKDIIEIIEG